MELVKVLCLLHLLEGGCSHCVQVRLQTQGQAAAQYRGPWHCLSSVLRTRGVPGLFRGLGPHFFRDGPGFGIYMVPHLVLPSLVT